MQKAKNDGTQPLALAGIGTRFLALVIDTLVLAALRFVLMLALAPQTAMAELVAAFVLDIATTVPYYWYFWTRRAGQTPGKSLLRIRVVSEHGAPLDDRAALLRVLGYYLGQLSLGLGFVWAAFNREQQGWHDKLARSLVVTSDGPARFFPREPGTGGHQN